MDTSEPSLELPPSMEVPLPRPPRGPAPCEPDDFFQVGAEAQGLRIYLRYPLFRTLEDFALRDTSREQAGLLLGRRDPQGGWIRVEEALEIGIDDPGGRFSEGSWDRARGAARQRYGGLEVLGWFHTHPGTGVELSAEEIAVHGRFFADPWQVVYVVDPVLRDRNFHRWRGGDLQGATGFRIYGKEEKVMTLPDRESPKGDEPLRERYVERALDKLQRSVRRPPVRPVDYGLGALQLLVLAALFWRPAPAVQGDQGALLRGQEQLNVQLVELSGKVARLEKHLADLRLIDEELGLAPEGSPSPLPAGQPQAAPPASPVAQARGGSVRLGATPAPKRPREAPPAGSKVRLYKVREGDTLSTISEKFYQTSALSVVAALGSYNRLKGPNYELWPGDTVKVPDRAALKR